MYKDNVQFKPIYAKDFKITDVYKREIEKAARIAGNKLVQEFRKPTRTWDEKPIIRSEKSFNTKEITIEVYIDETTEGGKHFLWLDEGVAKHKIAPVNKPYLAIPRDFIAKTIPNTLTAQQGYRGGGINRVFLPVEVAITARNFISQIEEKWDSFFYVTMEVIVDKMAEHFNK